MNEKKVVEKILKGDKEAFERFYKKEALGLRKYVISRVGDREEVEELVQDSFLAFLDSLPLFSFRSKLKTFLYSIARHEVADFFRRKYAKRALKLVPIVGEFVSKELYTTGGLARRIDKAYRKLLPEYARILQMKYEDNLSVKEIAEQLKLSAKAVESKLFRARKAFQLVYLELEINE